MTVGRTVDAKTKAFVEPRAKTEKKKSIIDNDLDDDNFASYFENI